MTTTSHRNPYNLERYVERLAQTPFGDAERTLLTLSAMWADSDALWAITDPESKGTGMVVTGTSLLLLSRDREALAGVVDRLYGLLRSKGLLEMNVRPKMMQRRLDGEMTSAARFKLREDWRERVWDA